MAVILHFLKKNWIRFLVALIIGVIPVVVFNAVNNTWQLAIGYCNGLFISAFLLIAISGLVALSLFGAFDIFSFYFDRRRKEDGTKENLYDYSARKKENRWKAKFAFLPYLIIGSLYLIASLILYFTL